MTTAIHEVEEVSAPSHRRFTFGAFGIAAIGAIAATLAKAQPASAALPSPCCSLGSNTKCLTTRCSANCKGGCPNYSCPGGYQAAWWYCSAGARLIGCGECVTATRYPNCNTGADACSIWWDDNACPS